MTLMNNVKAQIATGARHHVTNALPTSMFHPSAALHSVNGSPTITSSAAIRLAMTSVVLLIAGIAG